MLDLTAECIFAENNKPTPKGYVMIRYKGRKRAAHRVAWEEAYGEIPDGWSVFQMCCKADSNCDGKACKHKACIQLLHLKIGPTRHVEGQVKRNLNPKKKLRKTQCVHGHKYTEENTYVRTDGGRSCRMCMWLRLPWKNRESEEWQQKMQNQLLVYGLRNIGTIQ